MKRRTAAEQKQRISDEFQRRRESDGFWKSRCEEPAPDLTKIPLEPECDHSMLRRYLTRELCVELNLFEYFVDSEEVTITEDAVETGWEQIRDTLSANVGLGAVLVIKVKDMVARDRTLILEKIVIGYWRE